MRRLILRTVVVASAIFGRLSFAGGICRSEMAFMTRRVYSPLLVPVARGVGDNFPNSTPALCGAPPLASRRGDRGRGADGRALPQSPPTSELAQGNHQLRL